MNPLYCFVHLILCLALGLIFSLTFLLLDGVVDCSTLKILLQYMQIYIFISMYIDIYYI